MFGAGGHVPKADALQLNLDHQVSGDVAFFAAVTTFALLFKAVGYCQPQAFDDEGQYGGAKAMLLLRAAGDVGRGTQGSRTVGDGTALNDAETGAEG